jgi:hypothetical protein
MADPAGARTGNGVGPQLSETIERVACDAEAAIDKVIFPLYKHILITVFRIMPLERFPLPSPYCKKNLTTSVERLLCHIPWVFPLGTL